MLLAGWISDASVCEAAGPWASAPEAEVRLEKLAWEEVLEAVGLPAEGGLPACRHAITSCDE